LLGALQKANFTHWIQDLKGASPAYQLKTFGTLCFVVFSIDRVSTERVDYCLANSGSLLLIHKKFSEDDPGPLGYAVPILSLNLSVFTLNLPSTRASLAI
jgi:hypothetical protein